MEQVLVMIEKTFGLSQTPSGLDLGIILLILVLSVITVLDIFSTPQDEVKTEKKPEPNKETPTEIITEADVDVVEVVRSEEVVDEKPEPKVEEAPKAPVGDSWEKRLFKGLSRTRSEIWGKIGGIIGGKKLDDELVEEIEEILFTSDLSPVIVDELLEELKSLADADNTEDYLSHIKTFLQSKMQTSQDKVNLDLYKFEKSSNGPKVIMIVGVNGAGKTTTIGKLATKLRAQGASVVVGACDTFRAAAVEQLEVWCKRADVEIVKAGEGADPSGVAYDAVAKAKEINADYCIIDTAGRLHTKSNLMDELAKTKKVMSKVIPEAPHETLLVLDAITGQNALRQAEEFNKSLELSGLIFTKCDGSAKAGSAVSIVQSLNVPIVYIGVGEDVDDLNIFNLDMFLNALLGLEA